MKLRIVSLLLAITFLTTNVLAIGLDGTFGAGGKFMTTFATSGNPSSSATRVFIQPSGRIVAVGSHQQQGGDGRMGGVALAGLTAGGVLDTTFGSGGKALIWSFGANQGLTDAVMLPDGSILVLYQLLQFPMTNRPILAKFTVNGQPDAAFSADLEIVPNQTTPVALTAAEGKIYVLVRHGASAFYLVRLNSDGSRDTGFGANGSRSINLNRIPTYQRSIRNLHVLADGRVLITGYYYDLQTFYAYGFAMRLDSDSNLDRSFGRQGVFAMNIPGGSAELLRSVVQPDGKLVLGGYYTFLGSYTLLVRLTTRGRYDGTFGSAGIVMTSFNSISGVSGIAIGPDGKIYVAGTSAEKAIPSNRRLFVARFSAAGIRESFLITNFISDRDAGGSDIALQPDGKMVVGGFTVNPSDAFTQFAVARLLQ
jgi:uncharacterized delta-60 repeat protein